VRDKDSVGDKVLEVYQKESPSAIYIEDKSYFEKFYQGQKRLWQERLKMPLRAFKDALVLDYGCGTGETDVFLGLNGAEVRGVDFNPVSIERAQNLAGHFSLSPGMDFKVADVHDSVYQNGIADFVICLGVLPHVYNPKKVFNNMVNS
jgi:2-polyprenyl-3-methyl-5-hydroxy-6-metoxy-1,4-benzoquinol methylase